MKTELIHDRGRGPEIKGTRMTVYNLLSDFLDPFMTEARICALYDLTPDQVAAARAYVLNNADTVLAQYLRIDERIAAGIAAQDVQKATGEKGTFLKFKEWLALQDEAAAQEAQPNGHEVQSGRSPTFREWLIEQEEKEFQCGTPSPNTGN